MNNKFAYTLILIGVIILLFNLNYLNFSLIIQPKILPLVLISFGIIELIIHFLELGDLGQVIKGIAGLIFFIIIMFNFGYFFTRLIMPTQIPIINLDSSNSELIINEGTIVSKFNNVNITNQGSNLIINYYNNNEFLTNTTNYNYSYLNISNNFGNLELEISNRLEQDKELIFYNNFGNSKVNKLSGFNEMLFYNNFGQTIIHTGEINNERVMNLDSNFGNIILYIDEDADYSIHTSNFLGSINNNIGIESNNYENSTNKIRINIDNSFGHVEINRE